MKNQLNQTDEEIAMLSPPRLPFLSELAR